MTSRERLLTAFRKETPDRVPVGPFTLGALDWKSEAARELIRVADPMIDVGSGGDAVLGKKAHMERRVEGDKTISILHTPKGDLRQVRQRTSITSATMEFFCKTPEDADKWLSVPYEPPDIDLSSYESLKKDVDEEALIMIGIGDGICLPADIFSPENFSLLWLDAPDVMMKLTKVAADRINAYVKRLCEAGVDCFRIVGGEYASVQLGPKGFKDLVVDIDSETVDIMHKHGAMAYFHNHGPMKRFYDLIPQIGIDAIDPLEAPPWGDCELVEAKERIGKDVCLVGNLDDMEVLEKYDWREIETIAVARLQAAGPDGFVLGGTASGTYTERGAEMFRRMVDVSEAMSNRWD